MWYIEGSNVLVVAFLMGYLVLINYFLKRINNNHFGLKALIIFIFATLVLQIAKTIPQHPDLSYTIQTYAMLTIDMGTIFLFLKEVKYTFKRQDILRCYIELTGISLLFLFTTLLYNNTCYIRLHTAFMALLAIIVVLFRLFKGKNLGYDISFIISYIGYGTFCALMGFYELKLINSYLSYYLLIMVGFIFHIIGLTRGHNDTK